MKHPWLRIVAAMLPTLVMAQTAQRPGAQTVQAPGPFARIAMMHAREGHAVDWEAGYIRHLEWHRQAQDTFSWYSYQPPIREDSWSPRHRNVEQRSKARARQRAGS